MTTPKWVQTGTVLRTILEPTATVNIRNTGAIQDFNFGDVKVGSQQTGTLVFRNPERLVNGPSSPVIIDSDTNIARQVPFLSGPRLGDYSVDIPFIIGLEPGSSDSIKITFQPRGTGNRIAFLNVFPQFWPNPVNSITYYPFTVRLVGRGI